MKKLIVPKSVRKRARSIVYERIVRLIIYLLLAYIIIDFIYSGLQKTNFGNLSTTVFFLLIIPFWISGVPMKLIDRDWYGEIIKIELENNDPYKIDNHSQAPVSVKALVKTSDGKLYEKEIYDEGEYFSGERDNVYRVGDKVLHVRWTDYLSPVRSCNTSRPTACVICGCKSPTSERVCRSCGCSMDIKVIEVSKKK